MDKLLASLTKGRKKRWYETVERFDFKPSGRKSWNILRKFVEILES